MRGVSCQVEGSREKVACQLAHPLQETRSAGAEQYHKRQKLQRREQFSAGRKLAFAPALSSFRLVGFSVRCPGSAIVI